MGIYQQHPGFDAWGDGLPHAGGDIPNRIQNTARRMMAAPRRWGYTPVGTCLTGSVRGCPTQVGIYRQLTQVDAGISGLPHAGGDIPLLQYR